MDKMMPIIDVIIPAYNEQDSVALVVQEIPKDWVRTVVVVNNNSTDQTAQRAEEAGAIVLHQPIQGYGASCLMGIDYLSQQATPPEIIVFLDADHADYPDEIPKVVKPIIDEEYHMVIGSRALGVRERGSITPQQIFGNWLATWLLRLIYGYRFTDLGPFRAIRFQALQGLGMKDQNYGWTVEMQIKAAKQKLKCTEVPVKYRKRIGVSKVSGTVKGTILAGYKIITTLFKYA